MARIPGFRAPRGAIRCLNFRFRRQFHLVISKIIKRLCLCHHLQRNHYQKLFFCLPLALCFSGPLGTQGRKRKKTYEQGSGSIRSSGRGFKNKLRSLERWGIYDNSTHLKLKGAVCFTLNQALSTYTRQVKTAPHSLIRIFHWCFAFLA